MIFFTSDTHFFHDNIIKYCNRPYANSLEMNEALVRNWNGVVGVEDKVYHLGDFSMGGKPRVAEALSQLNGYKILIKGNHDFSVEFMRNAGFREVYSNLVIDTEYGKIYLNHIPSPSTLWSDAEYHFCGHVHEKWKRDGNVINVGTDVWDYTPRTLKEILGC